MQPANKVANDTFGNQYRLAAKSMKQAAVAASTTMQKRSLALLFQVGGWDCQNLHDVIVVYIYILYVLSSVLDVVFVMFESSNIKTYCNNF